MLVKNELQVAVMVCIMELLQQSMDWVQRNNIKNQVNVVGFLTKYPNWQLSDKRKQMHEPLHCYVWIKTA